MALRCSPIGEQRGQLGGDLDPVVGLRTETGRVKLPVPGRLPEVVVILHNLHRRRGSLGKRSRRVHGASEWKTRAADPVPAQGSVPGI